MPRLGVSPAQRHPASQQGGGGRWKPGRRSLGEEGGRRFLTILLFESIKFSMDLEPWIGGLAPWTSFRASSRGRDDSNESESSITHLNSCQLFLWMSVLDTVLRTKVLVRWFNKFKFFKPFIAVKEIQTNIIWILNVDEFQISPQSLCI